MIEFTINRSGVEYKCLIDEVDADLTKLLWHIQLKKGATTTYIRRNSRPDENGKRSAVFMHQMIMARVLSRPLVSGELVDHWNGIGTDNTRDNLRLATRTQNNVNTPVYKNNTTGVKGVMWNKKLHKYQAYMRLNGKQIHLGLFDSLEEAHKVRSTAMKHLHGEFAHED